MLQLGHELLQLGDQTASPSPAGFGSGHRDEASQPVSDDRCLADRSSQQYIFNVERLIGPPVDASRILWFDVAAGSASSFSIVRTDKLMSRLTKALRLDSRTTPEALAALKDPALPASKPLYSVQTARRLFGLVRLLDTFNMAPGTQSPPYFPDGKACQLTTPLTEQERIPPRRPTITPRRRCSRPKAQTYRPVTLGNSRSAARIARD
jgi:hypothetical protein